MAAEILTSDSLAVPRSVAAPTKAAAWLRYAAIFFAVCSGLGLAAHAATMFWAQNEFTQPESIVAIQSRMLVDDGSFYPTLRSYPYTVNAYMPVFYLLEAGLYRLGAPLPMGGRVVSFAALTGILVIVWRLIRLYTRNRSCAVMGLLLCSCASLLAMWGTTGQVDMLGVFFSLTSFYFFSRYQVAREDTLIYSALFALAALLTKQTLVAAPGAIFVLLAVSNRPQALRFGAILGISLGAVVFLANALTHGGFLANTVFANVNPFAWNKLKQHTDYMLQFTSPLILAAAICFRSVWKSPARPVLVYLGLSIAVLLVTASKIGSDSNYQIETTVLLAITASIGLGTLQFFSRFCAGDKGWITLLHLPLAVYMVLNLRLMYPVLLSRVDKEVQFRQQVSELKPLVKDGRAIFADSNAALRIEGRLEVEPLIYSILVQGGKIDPEPLRADLAAQKFSTLVLYTDVNNPVAVDPEIPRLTDSQNDEIRRHYNLIGRVPGPYMHGLFVYQPKGN